MRAIRSRSLFLKQRWQRIAHSRTLDQHEWKSEIPTLSKSYLLKCCFCILYFTLFYACLCPKWPKMGPLNTINLDQLHLLLYPHKYILGFTVYPALYNTFGETWIFNIQHTWLSSANGFESLKWLWVSEMVLGLWNVFESLKWFWVSEMVLSLWNVAF